MKKIISILFLAIMLTQTLPLRQWLGNNVAVNLLISEEEPDSEKCDQGKGSKEEVKALLIAGKIITNPAIQISHSATLFCSIPPTPHLDLLVPPPNVPA